MLTEIKKLLRHSFIYSFGNLSGHFLSFLLLPVYTRFLTAEQYGILALITVFRTIFERVVNFGTQSSVVKVYFEVNTLEEKKTVISTAFIFVVIVTFLFTTIFWLFRNKLSVNLLNSANLAFLFTFALLASFFFTVKTIPLSVFRAQEKPVTYSIFSFATLILGLLFNILFVVIFRENVKGIVKSAFLSQCIVFLLILIPFSKDFVLRFKKEYLSKMLTFGLPLVPSGLAMWILTLLDRYFLKVYTSLDTVGIYSLGYKIATIMSMIVIVPFSLAWGPLMLKWYKQKNAKKLFSTVYKYFSIIGFFVALLLSIFSKEVIRIMTTPPFYSAYKIVYFIVLAYLCQGFYMIFTAGCTFIRKTYYFPIATGVAAVLNTVLNILLIPHYKMMGAAIATIISYLIMTVLMYIFSERYYHIPFHFITTIKIGFITTCLYILGFFTGETLWVSVMMKFIIVLFYLPLLYFTGVFSAEEIEFVKKKLRKRKNK